MEKALSGYLTKRRAVSPQNLEEELSIFETALRSRAAKSLSGFAIAGGFLQVRPDKVVVMAEMADMASDIDLEKAAEARREAEKALEGGFSEGADLATARAALQVALLRQRVAERRHREGPRRRG